MVEVEAGAVQEAARVVARREVVVRREVDAAVAVSVLEAVAEAEVATTSAIMICRMRTSSNVSPMRISSNSKLNLISLKFRIQV